MAKPEIVSKYTDCIGAEKILGKASLLWRSPLELNDPFDMQWDPDWELRTPDSQAILRRAMREMICGHYDWRRVKNPEIRKAMGEARMQAADHPDRMNSTVDTMLRLMTSNGSVSESRKILERFLAKVRILCLSRNPNSVLMWSHYSQGHMGVRLDFDLEVLRRSVPCQAVDVEYTDAIPAIQPIETWVDVIKYGEPLQVAPDFSDRMLRTKGRDWSYEKEIRLARRIPGSSHTRQDVFSFDRKALISVSIGCRALDAFRRTVCRLVSENFPDSIVMQTVRAPAKFELIDEFREKASMQVRASQAFEAVIS